MKSFLKKIFPAIRPVALLFLSVFFDRAYLKGRHFNPGVAGYVWAIQSIWQRSILRLARPMPFPVTLTCRISNDKNVIIHPDDLNNFQSPGTYIQNFSGRIHIGRGSYIAPNVGIITANHDPGDLDAHTAAKDVVLGRRCWIGMNSIILPGVILGDETIVGAGSVVTKSFPNGRCVIAGNPARIIRTLDTSKSPEDLRTA